MQVPTIEQRFAAFRCGDRHALGDVFDRSAPNLLRVAVHVCHSVASAEDAVQATFLTAIQHAERWDPTRPLLPWLLGILGNQLRTQQAREARRVDPQRVSVSVDPSPDLVAMATEFDHELGVAIDRLPPAYRTTLQLHVRHGLSAAEIAHALQQPASTVRSQIARGLEKLRGYLPAGLASALALTLTPSRGLAAVKVVCTGAAVRSVGGAVSVGSSGGLVLALTALLTLGLGLWSCWDSSSPILHATVATQGVGASSANDSPAEETAAAFSRHAAERPGAAGGARLLSGRLFGDRDEPVVGARVVAWAIADQAERTAWAVAGVPTTTTDAEGRFGLSLPAGEWVVCSESPETTPATAFVHVDATPPAPIELRASHGRTLVGSVVDDRGAPVAGAHVGVRRTLVLRPGLARVYNPEGATVVSDSAGRFRIGGVDAARVELFASAVDHLTTTMSVAADGCELRLTRAAGIDVRVIDAGGRPVPGARVSVGANVAAVSTDGAGAANLRGLAAGRHQVEVCAAGHGRRVEAALLRAGESAALTIRLPAGATLTVCVHDHTGRPAAGADVHVGGVAAPRIVGATNRREGDRMLILPKFEATQVARCNAEGVAQLTGLDAGDITVTACSGDGVCPGAVPVHCTPGGEHRAALTLTPLGQLDLRVAPNWASGQPASVRLRVATAQFDMLAQVNTDAAGVATVWVPVGRGTAVLLSDHRPVNALGQPAHHPVELSSTAVTFEVLASQARAVTLRAPRQFTHTLAVRDAHGVVSGAVLMLGWPEHPDCWHEHRADASGQIVIAGLTAGVRFGLLSRVVGSPQVEVRLEVGDEGVNGPAQVTLPAGCVRVIVRGPIGPVIGAAVWAPQLCRREGGWGVLTPDATGAHVVTRQEAAAVRTDAQGMAVLADLPPGEQTVVVEHRDFVTLEARLSVGVGELRQQFDLQPAGSVRVRVRNAAGLAPECVTVQLAIKQATAAARVEGFPGFIWPPGDSWRAVTQRMVCGGEERFPSLAPGRYRVLVLHDGADLERGVEIDVRVDQETTVELTTAN